MTNDDQHEYAGAGDGLVQRLPIGVELAIMRKKCRRLFGGTTVLHRQRVRALLVESQWIDTVDQHPTN